MGLENENRKFLKSKIGDHFDQKLQVKKKKLRQSQQRLSKKTSQNLKSISIFNGPDQSQQTSNQRYSETPKTFIKKRYFIKLKLIH